MVEVTEDQEDAFLAIAREFVEAHGGRISVVSETSGGHFRVTLPRKPVRVLPVAA